MYLSYKQHGISEPSSQDKTFESIGSFFYLVTENNDTLSKWHQVLNENKMVLIYRNKPHLHAGTSYTAIQYYLIYPFGISNIDPTNCEVKMVPSLEVHGVMYNNVAELHYTDETVSDEDYLYFTVKEGLIKIMFKHSKYETFTNTFELVRANILK
jgi:hypothetical protein